mgnify:CR=1 FL=1
MPRGRPRLPESTKFGAWTLKHINAAINSDDYFELIIYGKRGRGKSIYAYKIAKIVYNNDLKKVWAHWVYTLDQLIEILDKYAGKDERIKLLVWDDAGVHGSKYKWFTEEQALVDTLAEVWQTIRDTVAATLITTPNPKLLLKAIRTMDTYTGKVVWADRRVKLAMLKIYSQNILPNGFILPKLIAYELFRAWLPDDEYKTLKSKRKRYSRECIDRLKAKREAIKKKQREKEVSVLD